MRVRGKFNSFLKRVKLADFDLFLAKIYEKRPEKVWVSDRYSYSRTGVPGAKDKIAPAAA